MHRILQWALKRKFLNKNISKKEIKQTIAHISKTKSNKVKKEKRVIVKSEIQYKKNYRMILNSKVLQNLQSCYKYFFFLILQEVREGGGGK